MQEFFFLMRFFIGIFSGSVIKATICILIKIDITNFVHYFTDSDNINILLIYQI